MALTERKILYRVIFSAVLLVVSLITSGLAWGHWAYTLDTCSGVNCGCILFADLYSNGFAGGNIKYCEFVTFAQIPVFITSTIFIFYFCYRACTSNNKSKSAARKANPLLSARNDKRRARTNDAVDNEEELELPSLKVRITLLVFSLLMVIILLSAAVLGTVGFFRSCKEYRRYLVKELNLSGNAAEVVGSRMACTAVFDFLDFLQPDRKDFDEPLQYSRKDRINTGVTLLISKTALFMNFVNWVYISVFNIQRLWNSGRCCRSDPISYRS